MFEKYHNLFQISKDYKRDENLKTIFFHISPVYYYENYLSDIIAYYLRNESVKKIFIKWLSRFSDKPILYELYRSGDVIRERHKIDVLLLSSTGKNAIIIENKSNNADDMEKQIPRYYNKLNSEGIEVDFILYLNKNSLSHPDQTSWSKNEIETISKITHISQLIGKDSFYEVIENFIASTNDIRLNGISQELKLFLKELVFGVLNMETMELFEKELNKLPGGLDDFKQVIKAYNDLPVYLANKYKTKVDQFENNPFKKIWFWKDTCLVLDHLIFENKTFAVDIWFSVDEVNFSFFTRDGNDKNLENYKVSVGNKFPFKEKIENRYYLVINDVMNENLIISALDKIIKCFS